MKQFNIANDGKIKYLGSKKAPSLLYGEYDCDTLMVHFSEDHKTVQVQMEALKDILKDALKGRTAKQVKQRSKNVVGFSLEDETDVSAVKASAVRVVEILKKEAWRINSELSNGAQPTGNSGTKQPSNNNSGSKEPTGNGGSKQSTGNGGKQPTGNSGTKQPTGNNGGKQPAGTQPTGNSGAKQPSNNGSNKQSTGNGNPQGNNGAAFDKTKDIYGVPLKQARPGLFEMCETPEDEEKVYDWYWDMVHRVNTKVVPNPFRSNG